MAWAVAGASGLQTSQRPSFTAKRTVSPLGSRQSTTSGTAPCTRPSTAAAAAAAEQAPVVKPVRVPRRTVFSSWRCQPFAPGVQSLRPPASAAPRPGPAARAMQPPPASSRPCARESPSRALRAGWQSGLWIRRPTQSPPACPRPGPGAHPPRAISRASSMSAVGALPMPTMAPCKQAQAVGFAHGLHRAGGVFCWARATTSASEMNWWVCMPKCARRGMRQARADHLHIGHHRRAATQHGADAQPARPGGESPSAR